MTPRPPLRLLQLTDPHLFADPDGEIYGVRTDHTFRAALSRAFESAAGPIDALLVTGDIAEDGLPETYQRFHGQVASLGVPVLCIPGNHEHRDTMAAILDRPPVQFCGALRLPGWRIVMLDSHLPGMDEGRLGTDELRRLERELNAAAAENVLIGLHHPPLPVGSPWLDAFGLVNGDALLSCIAGRGNVRGVLFGHVHQESDQLHAGLRMMSTPSTCAQFTPRTERCIMDLRPPGFRRLELWPDGRIDTEVVWLEELRRSERPPDSRQPD